MRAPSSVIGLVTAMSSSAGNVTNSAPIVTMPMITTTTKAALQPRLSPSQVANGTPRTLATDNPRRTRPTALARLRGPARCAATRAATPKYAPCGSPATNLATMSVPKFGASTVAALPTVNATISAINSVRRDIRAVSAAMSGAPTTTPSA
ncbi:Uncharacterised protein [Mycobacteroides abscessus subsp. abscessus]|nr:Uncharacterised protein [Mycobacteroides abscessus subsp. abscessus]